MGDNLTRIVIKTMVRKALRDIREDPERSTRNLVDMAMNCANGRFQERFFQTAQQMLTNEESAYYTLARNIVENVAEERLLTFGMNLGYNGCTYGAKWIRKIEAEQGFNIPWTISLEITADSFADHEAHYHGRIEEGECLGIYTWCLFSKGSVVSCINLAAAHPNSAFCLFCHSEEITPGLITYLNDVNNLMLLVLFDDLAETACALLREAEVLYSIYYPYSEKDLSKIEDGSLLREMERTKPAFAALVPDQKCSEALQERVYQVVYQARMNQTYAMIVWELYQDHRMIDRIISGDECWASFDSHGEGYHTLDRMPAFGCNLFENDLASLLKQMFPKSVVIE